MSTLNVKCKFTEQNKMVLNAGKHQALRYLLRNAPQPAFTETENNAIVESQALRDLRISM